MPEIVIGTEDERPASEVFAYAAEASRKRSLSRPSLRSRPVDAQNVLVRLLHEPTRQRRGATVLPNELWDSRVQPQATTTRLAALNKIKKLDAADPNHKISYALITLGTNGLPSVSTIKSAGTAVPAKLTIPPRLCAAIGSETSRCSCSPVETPPTTQK